jgi:hypothetical protein
VFARYDHVANCLRTTDVTMTPKPSVAASDANETFLTMRTCGSCSSLAELDSVLRAASALSLTREDSLHNLLSEKFRTFAKASCLSLSCQDKDQSGLADRLKKIEDLWNILSRRMTRIEQKVVTAASALTTADGEGVKVGVEELEGIKMELAELKTDTMIQVMMMMMMMMGVVMMMMGVVMMMMMMMIVEMMTLDNDDNMRTGTGTLHTGREMHS